MLKAFGAGVILATGFIHMWPDANDAFSNPYLGEWASSHLQLSLTQCSCYESGLM